MFQPFNESFVQSTVEATINRYAGETEEERALRERKSYQPSGLGIQMRQIVHAVGHAFLNMGERLEKSGGHNTPLVRPSNPTH
jgi:hypothetical protein